MQMRPNSKSVTFNQSLSPFHHVQFTYQQSISTGGHSLVIGCVNTEDEVFTFAMLKTPSLISSKMRPIVHILWGEFSETSTISRTLTFSLESIHFCLFCKSGISGLFRNYLDIFPNVFKIPAKSIKFH
jgi:hypothetical protein